MADAFTWHTAAPQDQGFSPQGLEALRSGLARRRTRAFILVRRDRVVCEWYAPDFAPTRRHYTASLAKSLVGGLALNLALQDDLVGLDEVACDYIPAWQADPVKSQVRIVHLATHCSGLDDATEGGTPHGLLSGWKAAFWKRQTPDPFSVARDLAPIITEPGTRFLYSNPGSAMLACAVTAALAGTPHLDIRTLLRERVYRPIGLADGDWDIGYGTTYHVDGLPLVPTWAGGFFTARATARIGRLLLARGDWQGRRILDADALARCTSYAGTPLPDRSVPHPWPAPTPGWWSNFDGAFRSVPRDAFCGAGSGNQILLVIPSLDMIVVRNGGRMGDRPEVEDFWAGLQDHLFTPLMAALA